MNGSAIHWSDTIKLHLKHPGVDGINLLSGARPFILKLDNDTPTVGKVCKGYNAVARNNLLSVKIASPSLANVEGYELHPEVLIDGFKRKHDYEITNVQKNPADTWAWLLAPIPKQVEKLVKYYVPFRNELIHTIVKKCEKLSKTASKKKLSYAHPSQPAAYEECRRDTTRNQGADGRQERYLPLLQQVEG